MLLPCTIRQAYDAGPVGLNKAADEGDIALVRYKSDAEQEVDVVGELSAPLERSIDVHVRCTVGKIPLWIASAWENQDMV